MRVARLAMLTTLIAFTLQTSAFAQKFAYDGFNTSSIISLSGTASIVNGVLRLTPDASYSTGDAWYPQKVRVGVGFTTSFQFRITHSGPNADDISFYIKRDLGPLADTNHYSSNFVAIEFDTYRNPEYDPNGNHIAIMGCGPGTWNSLDGSGVGWPDHTKGCTLSITSSIGATLADGNVHSVSLSYTPGSVVVSLDGKVVGAAAMDLVGLIASPDGTAAVGISAFSGLYCEQADILKWSFKSSR